MPELQHHFRVGRMNKDLDERLVPNGEYRDAQNIEIVTSEGSDVGSVQNVIGNQLKDGKTYNASTTALTLWGTGNNTNNQSIKELTSPECIGSVVDNQNDKIYWFITATASPSPSTPVSVIAEFNYATNEIKPILVDKNNILNFSNQYLITGANVIEGLLLWTDNQTEPKKIKISSFKSGSTDFNTHTTFNGSDFTENDITTIKLSPFKAPTLTLSASKRGGAGAGIGTEVYTNFDFTYDEDTSNLTPNIVRPAGQEVTLNFTPKPEFLVGDIITLTYDHTDSDNKETTYKIKVLIKTLVNDAEQVIAIIQSIPTDTPIGVFAWEAVLDEEEPLFENKFVRFGYRWKYKDGEYSTYSPFSTVAFLPSTFAYKSSDGHNVGMSNNVRQLIIGGFDTQPADVDEVDILYKESNNNLVYVADTLKNNETEYEIKSEIIGSVVQSNQILRPWDNVPKRAKAQEVTANRLIYANYYQNYDILKQNLPDIQTTITQKEITTIGDPEASLKSLRTYQVGGIYIDNYGRETPVFSNKSAAQQIGKSYAESVNNLTCKMLNDPPSWATHFKYYVKETSNEYYNLALDRFYIAEDGNVWLSFPSSERNKVKEDAYLILKKQHDKNTFVASAAKYKVLDISNEAPAFITKEIKTIASAKCKILTAALNAPGVGRITFQFRGPKDTENTNFARGFTSDGMLTISTTGGTTERYEIASGGATGQQDAASGDSDPKSIYEVTLTKPLKDTESTVFASGYTDAHDELTITLYEEQTVDKAEFFGRFFAKINRDTVFDTNIIDTFPSMVTEYAITRNRMVDVDSSNDWGSGGIFVTILLASAGIPSAPHWFEKSSNAETLSWTDTKAKTDSKDHEDGVRKDFTRPISFHPSLGDTEFKVYWTGVKTGLGKDRSHDKANTLNPFLEALGQTGTLFQFVNDAGNEGAIYEVTNTTIEYEYRGGRKPQQKKITGKRRVYTVAFKNVETGEGYDDNFVYSNSSSANGRITNIRIMQKLLPFDNESLTSENPAVFETEPREAIDLELFYEASNSLPIIKQGMTVTGAGIPAGRTIAGIIDKNSFKLSGNTNLAITNVTLTITSADGVYNFTVIASASNSATTVTLSEGQVHGQLQTLDWFNCYSFGQGVESDRLKDDYNAVKIDKGPKVSSVLAEQYKEDQKQNGLIWSGIFNSTSGINRLNQFVQAEPITKDLNPQYGSIQKLRARDTDLIAFCEDKVLKILANKDALYEAGGNQQLTATNRVLGQAIPYLGEFGISKNPESFASHAYRVYFTDKSRGAVLRLSRDGLTNIAQKGMTDWFKDNLATSTTLLGAYDEYKGSYNLTLKGTNDYNVCFDERVDGWTGFKTFIPESSCSLNNTYYSFKNADLYSHDNAVRNTFYGAVAQPSSVTVLINDIPSSMKSFKTINYEGSKSRKYTYTGTIGGTSYSGLTWGQINPLNPTEAEWTGLSETVGKGWYCDSIVTDKQSGVIKEFIDKEGKWFNYIKGDTTTLTNLDSKEFAVQGVGTYSSLGGDTVPTNRNVTISLNNTTSSHNTDVSATSVLSKTPGSSVSENVVLSIKPNTGFAIAHTSFAFVSETSSTVADAMGNATFTQSGDNVNATIPLSFTMPGNAQTVQANITGAATAVTYTVAGTYSTVEENTNSDPASLVDVAYNGTGTYDATTATVFTKTFTIVNGYKFNTKPTCEIVTEDLDDVSGYTIVETNWDAAVGNTITFTVKYVYGTNNPTTDKILFTAKADKVFVTPTTQITGFSASSKSISRRGETRAMLIIGENGATFKFRRRINTGSWGSYEYWNGTIWTTDTTLTMGTSPTSITEVYANSATSKTFEYQIVAVNPVALGGNLDADNDGDHTFIIGQDADVTLSIKAVESNSQITDRVAADTIEKTYYAYGEPSDNNDYGSFPISMVLLTNHTFTELRPPTADDFTNTSTTANVTDDGAVSGTNPTVNLGESNYSLVSGMKVEGAGIPDGSTINTVDSDFDQLVLATPSSATIADSAELSFYPPNDWDYDLDNVVSVLNNTPNPSTYTITADALVNKYGSTDLISDINVDNFLQTTGSSGGNVYITTQSVGTSSVLSGKTYYGGSPRAVFTSASGNTAVTLPGTDGASQTVGTVSITGNWSGNTFANGDIKAELYIPTASDDDIDTLLVGGVSHNIAVSGSGVAGTTATGTISDVVVTFDQTITNTADLQIGVRIWLQNDPG